MGIKTDKKVRITVSVPNGEGAKLKSFPYYASFIVSCLLEEFFSRADVSDMMREMNRAGVEEKLEGLRRYIRSVCFSSDGKRKNSKHAGNSKKKDYWKLIEE